MKDQAIAVIAEEACKGLKDCPWHMECNYLIPSYNGLLMAARANHPDDPFLNGIEPIRVGESGGINAPEIYVLFAQLRIAIESMLADESFGSEDSFAAVISDES
jgi:hypothetical protein